MEPLPETVEAIEDYGPFIIEDDDLLVEKDLHVDHHEVTEGDLDAELVRRLST